MSACAALGCETPVASDRLMCRRHWFMLPKEKRVAVWQAYRGEAGDYEWAREEAIKAVADREARESLEPQIDLELASSKRWKCLACHEVWTPTEKPKGCPDCGSVMVGELQA
jgi:rubrerythrin